VDDRVDLENLIIDDEERGLFRVHRRALIDPEVLRIEKERIFDRCWIYAGHESEIPSPGDFRTRKVAGRPVILVRGDDGKVRVLLNTCMHRGAQVCPEPSGHSKIFQCYYHGWTYDNRGRLIGIPDAGAYSSAFDRLERSLRAPLHTDSYRGFIFVSFNPNAESLIDYLAGAVEYLDLVADQSEEGLEIVRGTHSFSVKANWKLIVENAVDDYHVRTTHQRFLQYLEDTRQLDPSAPRDLVGVARDLGNGHAAVEREAPWARPIAKWSPIFGESRRAEFAKIQRRFAERFGDERARRITLLNRNLNIFPNLSVNDIMGVVIRTYYPCAPDYMEVDAWCLAPKGERLEDRAMRLENFLSFLGPAGFANPDDAEVLESVQRGYATVKEVEWSDVSRGMKSQEATATGELQLRVFWRQWHRLITGRRVGPGVPGPLEHESVSVYPSV
jgi:phenylpropionate dioxygenase-like ring-hydroxylating dioxygenase large terminal subunit